MFYYISSRHQFKLSFIIQHLNCFLICLQRKDLTVGMEYLYSTDTNVQATWLCKMFNMIWCNMIDRIWRNSVNVQLQKYNTVLSFGSKIYVRIMVRRIKWFFYMPLMSPDHHSQKLWIQKLYSIFNNQFTTNLFKTVSVCFHRTFESKLQSWAILSWMVSLLTLTCFFNSS